MRAFNIRPRDYLSKAKVRKKFTYANKFTKKLNNLLFLQMIIIVTR